MRVGANLGHGGQPIAYDILGGTNLRKTIALDPGENHDTRHLECFNSFDQG